MNTPEDLFDFESFQSFLTKNKSKFLSISYKTNREYSLEDIENEALVTAYEVSEKYKINLDFNCTIFQDKVIAFLYQKLVNYAEHVVQYAFRIDQTNNNSDHDTSGEIHPILQHRTSESSSNPIDILIKNEDDVTSSIELGSHSSRAHAYLSLLRRFNNKMDDMAKYLLICSSYCYFRFNEALTMVETQLSLPEEGLWTESAASPKTWRPYKATRDWIQLSFHFEYTDFFSPSYVLSCND